MVWGSAGSWDRDGDSKYVCFFEIGIEPFTDRYAFNRMTLRISWPFTIINLSSRASHYRTHWILFGTPKQLIVYRIFE